MTDNMKIWNNVCKTDPAHTKGANVRGNNITAIAPQSQIMKATEQFGPYGASWGLSEIKYDYALSEKIGVVLIHCVFFYPGGKFPISSSISVYKDNAKTKVDDDFAKKIETDVLTKALSKIGFNADVFMGLYDDHRYVESMKEEFNKKPVVSAEQVENIRRELDRCNMSVDQFCKSWGMATLEELHAINFDNAMQWIAGSVKQKIDNAAVCDQLDDAIMSMASPDDVKEVKLALMGSDLTQEEEQHLGKLYRDKIAELKASA